MAIGKFVKRIKALQPRAGLCWEQRDPNPNASPTKGRACSTVCKTEYKMFHYELSQFSMKILKRRLCTKDFKALV
jgi:hypothetical protein